MNIANITLILSVVATMIAVGSFFVNRKKTKADIESIYLKMNTDQAMKIAELEIDLTEVKNIQRGLQRALNERDEYIIILLDGNRRLNIQLKDCEEVPCWEPPKPDFLYKENGSQTKEAKV
jgi:hypothetical protein